MKKKCFFNKKIFSLFICLVFILSFFSIPSFALINYGNGAYRPISYYNGAWRSTWNYPYSQTDYISFQFLLPESYGSPTSYTPTSVSDVRSAYRVASAFLYSLGIPFEFNISDYVLDAMLLKWYGGLYGYVSDVDSRRDSVVFFNESANSLLGFIEENYSGNTYSQFLSSSYFLFCWSQLMRDCYFKNLSLFLTDLRDNGYITYIGSFDVLLSSSLFSNFVTVTSASQANALSSIGAPVYIRFDVSGYVGLNYQDFDIGLFESKSFLTDDNTWSFLPDKWRSKIIAFVLFCVSLAAVAFTRKILGAVG